MRLTKLVIKAELEHAEVVEALQDYLLKRKYAHLERVKHVTEGEHELRSAVMLRSEGQTLSAVVEVYTS